MRCGDTIPIGIDSLVYPLYGRVDSLKKKRPLKCYLGYNRMVVVAAVAVSVNSAMAIGVTAAGFLRQPFILEYSPSICVLH